MGLSLKDGVEQIPAFYNPVSNELNLPTGMHFHPGSMAVLAAFINSKRISSENCTLPNEGYLEAVGLPKALWGIDNYDKDRINVGVNYSLVTALVSADLVDEATTSINDCIRKLSYPGGGPYPDGIAALTHVVGELHDNVWSHGRSTGFSFAQKSAVPYTNKQEFYLEFGLADSGLGFLRELQRTNIPDIGNHQDAIQWCIQEGNSSKHAAYVDDWAQQLPDGHIGGNVFGGNVPVREGQNNHQGLGLWHLMRLVNRYDGDFMLISGDVCLESSVNGPVYSQLKRHWQGVAISCRFRLSKLSVEPEEAIDPEIAALMEILGGA
ncbi:TPA: hypothetical protein NBH86_000847 [Serratia marcescens]|nr:hypothetical protein [Serratia marcescens]